MFITHAQNFEDVMLYRALHGVGSGFYIDVGANLPDVESVTKAFYERGWSGINIEPSPHAYKALAERRTRDINLNVACGASAGSVALRTAFGNEALATIEPAMVNIHERLGHDMTSMEVEMVTLGAICEEHVQGDIHFLKVDVEGAEMLVFQGINLRRWRPWIIVAEAHSEDFTATHYLPWERVVLSQGYRFAYTDGLNRFYLAEERWSQLAHAFTRPPNVYDQWRLPSQVHA